MYMPAWATLMGTGTRCVRGEYAATSAGRPKAVNRAPKSLRWEHAHVILTSDVDTGTHPSTDHPPPPPLLPLPPDDTDAAVLKKPQVGTPWIAGAGHLAETLRP